MDTKLIDVCMPPAFHIIFVLYFLRRGAAQWRLDLAPRGRSFEWPYPAFVFTEL